ncbi:MAG: hypothetical protein HY561_07480 [Gemmatimonadetes bacterium]|nr:hypothetical protein [Gemmatimonadota bacterium]
MNVRWGKAVFAGIAATAAMTVVGLYLAPMMRIPRMNPAAMLAGAMGGSVALGWTGHFMIGTILAALYATIATRLFGAPWLRGALYGVAPWLMAQLVVIPMMGMPVFSGSAVLAGGSLLGHLIYGSVVGTLYGAPAAPAGVRLGLTVPTVAPRRRSSAGSA